MIKQDSFVEGKQYRVVSREGLHFFSIGTVVTFIGYDDDGDAEFSGEYVDSVGNNSILHQFLRAVDLEEI